MIETMDPFGRILIADPDKAYLSVTTDLLQREGYLCTSVPDCIEAYRALEANEYDLLIAEIGMPGNGELQLVQAARRFAPRMPVILLTGRPSMHSALASIHLSVSAYLIKPVEFSFLLHHIKVSIADHHDFKLHNEVEMKQIDALTSAIAETIEILQSTRSSFNSKKLAALRRKLERLLASGQPE